MKRLVTFPLEEGSTIVVEVDEPDKRGTIPAGRGDLPEKARQTFEEAVSHILPVTKSVVDKLRSISSQPDEIEVVFGFNLSAEVGAFVASASTAANFGVALRWTHQKKDERTV